MFHLVSRKEIEQLTMSAKY